MDFLESQVPVPTYFAGSAGETTVAKLKQLLRDLAALREPHGHDWLERQRIACTTDCLGSWGSRFAGGRAEGDKFDGLMTSCDALALAVAEPDFEHFYWSPENRGRVVSLLIGFVSAGRCIGVRVVSVHTDGKVVGVHDFGAVDFCCTRNNVKYDHLRDDLRQHAKNPTGLLPERS